VPHTGSSSFIAFKSAENARRSSAALWIFHHERQIAREGRESSLNATLYPVFLTASQQETRKLVQMPSSIAIDNYCGASTSNYSRLMRETIKALSRNDLLSEAPRSILRILSILPADYRARRVEIFRRTCIHVPLLRV
jgi:hypothetical protein